MRRSLLGLGAACLVAVSACSEQTHHYADALELRSAAVNAGLHCTNYTPDEKPAPASSSGRCVGEPGSRFFVFKDDKTAKQQIDAAKKTMASQGYGMLYGPNWYVLTAKPGDIKDGVGGHVAG